MVRQMKKNEMLKKIISLTCILTLLMSIPTSAFASESNYGDVQLLVSQGYTVETASALSAEDRLEIAQMIRTNPSKIDINTLSLEVDNLMEIEALFSYSDAELNSMGADLSKVNKTKNELLTLCENKSVMARSLNANDVQVDMIRRAVEKGLENKRSGKGYDKKTGVNASGSITTSEMTYTQSVSDYSTSSKPEYKVNISYTWKEVYALAVFDDVIVAAWGGGFNTKSISSRARYYRWASVGGDYGSYHTYKTMDKTETAQAGIEFEFPQSVSNGWNEAAKTKSGYAKFTLYQNQYQGYDTKVLSHYCHQVISLGGASIGISASGPSVGITIGKGYDTTAQKATTLTY